MIVTDSMDLDDCATVVESTPSPTFMRNGTGLRKSLTNDIAESVVADRDAVSR
jgi:hypothetical protein